MSASMAAEVRRFIWLIDVLYDHKTKLLLSAAVAIEDLCSDDKLPQECQRAVSRLSEMQSDTYMAAERTYPMYADW